MYKRHIIVLIIIFLCSTIFSYYAKIDYLHNNFLSNLITFLSITVGFIITSISILFSSNTIKNFYNEVDKEKNTITKLHRLKNYYNFAVLTAIISVVIALLLSLFEKQIVVFHFILGVLAINVYIFIIMFSLLLNLFVFENSKKL